MKRNTLMKIKPTTSRENMLLMAKAAVWNAKHPFEDAGDLTVNTNE